MMQTERESVFSIFLTFFIVGFVNNFVLSPLMNLCRSRKMGKRGLLSIGPEAASSPLLTPVSKARDHESSLPSLISFLNTLRISVCSIFHFMISSMSSS
jgi:hypothetical protein